MSRSVPRALCLLVGLLAAVAVLAKERLFVLTDINNEPDDEESLVRLLVYANEIDIEGLVATTGCWLPQGPIRPDIVHGTIDAYGQVLPNLKAHAQGWPEAARLHAVVAAGQTGYGVAATGPGKSTAGSRLLGQAICRDDARPLWVAVWGGANTLLQTLSDLEGTVPAAELERLLKRVNVYSISDQDDAGPVVRRKYPALTWVVDPSRAGYKTYAASTWNGISGDRNRNTGLFPHLEMTEHAWLKANICVKGPLGARYRLPECIMEGDTPSFLGLVQNGLDWSPAKGGWGGRYDWYQPLSEEHPIWTSTCDSRDKLKTVNGELLESNGATIARWRKDYQDAFACRMQWSVSPNFADGNHAPAIRFKADGMDFSADGTSDPDGDALTYDWFVYEEASTLKGARLEADGVRARLVTPAGAKGTVQVILRVVDDRTPSQVAYRRVEYVER